MEKCVPGALTCDELLNRILTAVTPQALLTAAGLEVKFRYGSQADV
jgi:hypothetical protein